MNISKLFRALVAPAAVVIGFGAACDVPDDAFIRPMVFPVDGDVNFTNTFGAPRSGGRSHEGQDLMAKQSTPIVAPEAGTVTWFVHSSSGSAGNALSITTDDGWTYRFMHLNNDTPGTDDGKNQSKHAFGPGIKLGAKVKAGQLIGYVGDSGNAEATAPHLHFELRNAKNQAVDPAWSLMVAEDSPYSHLFEGYEPPKTTTTSTTTTTEPVE